MKIAAGVFADGCTNLVLEEIEEYFKAQGIEYIVDDSVIENPPVESVAAFAKVAQDYKPDFPVAIGGGSSMDTAKGVSYLIKHPAWTHTRRFIPHPAALLP